MFEFLGCQIDVEPQRMNAVVLTESAGNPFAVGVVGHSLSRQPGSEDEALALIKRLRTDNLNFSVGLAQVNKTNFAAYDLTDSNMFDKCSNLSAGSQILKKCHDLYGDWDRAYSCYYSGNPTTGVSHGYVAKVNKNMSKGLLTDVLPTGSSALPIQIFARNGGSNVVQQPSLLTRRLSSDLSIY